MLGNTVNVIDVSGLDDRDLDRLLAGKAPVNEEAAISQALAEVTAFSTGLPAADVASAHVRAMTNLAREVAMLPEPAPVILTTGRRSRWATHRPLATGLAGAALAVPLCVAAIAAAGVGLPHTVRAPYEAVGIALPNQAQPRVVTAALRNQQTGKSDRHNTNEPNGSAEQAHPNAAASAGTGNQGGGASGGQGGASNPAHGPRVAPTSGRAANAGAQAGAASGAGAPSSEAAGGQAGAQAEGGSSGNPSPAGAGQPSAPSGGGHPSSGLGGPNTLPRPAGGGHSLPAPSAPVIASKPGKGCQDANQGLLDLGGVLSGRGPLQLLEEQCPTPHR